MKNTRTSLALLGLLTGTLLASGTIFAQTGKMPAVKAGTIGQPTGKIAFLREKSLWIMDANGTNPLKIVDARNAEGRLSWAPDGRRIAFTRVGSADFKGPDMASGGGHKLYDIFLGFLDSARANNSLWWLRLTDNLGSKDPEWSGDGSTITFFRDMNARDVDAERPNYQICTMSPDGGNLEPVRKDWRNTVDQYLMNPSVNPVTGEIACVVYYEFRPQGIAILPKGRYGMPMDSAKMLAKKLEAKMSPSWSPDGKWLAYVANDMNKPGISVVSANLADHYLIFEPPPGATIRTAAPPSWSPDSKWLTFATTDGSIWISDITGNQQRRLSGPGMDDCPAWSKAMKF